MFMDKHFYRKVAICAIATCSASFTLAQVETPKVKPRTGPRAVSVLEVDAMGRARMVPVAILFQDRYYDASQYQSNPVPMALEPGNVYDVLQSNAVVGLFTTGQAQQLRGNWVGLGKWKEKSKEPEPKPAKVEVTVAGGGDDHPVLKRHQSSSDSNPKGDDDPDRPTLKRPEASSTDSASSGQTSTPTLAKRSAEPVDQDLTRDTNESDPDRPVLRKNPSGVNPTDVDVKMTPPVGAAQKAAPAKLAPQPSAEQWKQYVAISDAEKTDYRPFAYDLKPEEKTRFVAQMQKIAAFNLQKWALAHGGVKLPAKLTFTDFDLRAFDVDYSNNPELIFTASFTPAAPAKAKPITYYLTLVARGDANDELTPLFSQITDSTRLDAYSRLELIDAVDVDGYGRGSLLFREYTDSGKAFIVYRVDSYNLTKLFEGSSGE
jgi:hypothetical protein